MLGNDDKKFSRSADPLRRLADLSPNAFFIADSDGVMKYVNRAAADFFGCEKGDEPVEKLISDLIDTGQKEHLAEFIRTLETSRASKIVLTFPSENGDPLRAEITAKVLPGGVWAASLTDITEYKRLEERLRFSEERFKTIAENSEDAVFRLDDNGRIAYCNPAAAEVFGPGELLGKPVADLFPGGFPDELFPAPAGKVRGDKGKNDPPFAEISARRTNGESFQTGVSLSEFSADKKRFHVLIARDPGRLRKIEKQPAHLAAIVEDSDDAIISKDLDGIIMSWNTGAENLYGYTAAEIIGRPVTVLIPPQYMNEEPRILERIKRGEKIEHYETWRKCKDGTLVEISLTVSPIRDSRGRIIGASKIARNITDRKRTENELRESQMMLALAMRSSRMGVWEHDIATDIVYWSPELEEIFGLEKGEFPQTRSAFYEMIHEDDREKVFYEVEAAIREKRDYVVEFRFYHRDGAVRWMEGRGQALYAEDGTPVRVYGSGIDITERKIVEEKIKESENLFRTMADNISQFAWMADEKGSIFWYNRRWFEYTGTTLEEMQGWGWKNVHHPDHVDRVVKKIKKSWDTGEIWEDTFPLRSKDGTYRWFLSRALPIRDEAGKVIRWFGTNTDITDRMEAEEALLAANRSKDEFLSILSHELRTPLNSILGWIRMLRSGELDPEKTAKALETIERNARLQSSLIEDLLDVSRIISGKLHIEIEKIDLVSVIRSSIESVSPLADSRRVSIHFECPFHSLDMNGDQTKLQQIVVNLLNNAVKFTPAGGEVRLKLSETATHARLVVEDSGIGIDPEFLPFIFDRFRQADSTIQRNFSGLGLGLTIVKHLAELHGGTISAFSEGIGKGAIFLLELPIKKDLPGEKPPAPETADVYRPNDMSSLADRRILLVDDDCDGIEPLQIYLEAHGAEVVCADSPVAALEYLAVAAFDLIISDIGMPGIDGYRFVEKLKSLNTDRPVPAIALTAFAGPEDRRRAIDAGFSHHLAKPVDYELLLKIVRDFLHGA